MSKKHLRLGFYVQEWIDDKFVEIFGMKKVSKTKAKLKLVLDKFYSELEKFIENDVET